MMSNTVMQFISRVPPKTYIFHLVKTPEVSRFVYAVTPVPSSRGRFYTRFFFFHALPPP